jgi:hypothetical protein
MTYNYIFAALGETTVGKLAKRLGKIGAKCKGAGGRVFIAYPDSLSEDVVSLAAGGHINIHARGSEATDGDFDSACLAWL